MNTVSPFPKLLHVFVLLALLFMPGLIVSADMIPTSAATADEPQAMMVKDINPDQTWIDSNVRIPTALGEKLFFAYNDGEHGFEPWISDGTADGTKMLADIISGPGDGLYSGTSGDFYPAIVANPSLYFVGADPIFLMEPWKTNGTPESTEISSIPYSTMASVGNEIFYYDQDSLYRTEDNQSVSIKVKTWDSSYSIAMRMTAWNGEVYFFHYIPSTSGGSHTGELWKSNGTEAGTFRLFSFQTNFYSPGWIVVTNGLAFFAPPTPEYGIELWQTDGTLGGTRLVEDVNPSGNLLITSPTVVGDTLFFVGDNLLGNVALYKTRGVSTGVEKIREINANFLTNVDGTLYFLENAIGEDHIWKSNGTPAGTVEVCSACAYHAEGRPVAFMGKLYFAATDSAHGTELWVTDGTASGTRVFQDIYPGDESSSPIGMTKVAKKLFFAANDGTHGQELWVYDRSLSDYQVFLPNMTR